MLAFGVAGCGSEADAPTTVVVTSTSGLASEPAPSAPPSSSAASVAPSKLGPEFAAFAKTLGGQVAFAVVPVGGTAVVSGGPLKQSVAWSTSKVPVAMAVLKRSPTVTATVRAAIVDSDNGAAEQLWASLGDADAAGAAVQAVLAENGDKRTTVQTRRVRAGFTPFGQTVWGIEQSALFAAHIPCTAEGRSVYRLMTQVAGNQRWGMISQVGKTVTEVGVKGGWGPVDGGSLVRQIAVIKTAKGSVGVSIAAIASDGSQGSGQGLVTSIARWLADRAGALPAGKC